MAHHADVQAVRFIHVSARGGEGSRSDDRVAGWADPEDMLLGHARLCHVLYLVVDRRLRGDRGSRRERVGEEAQVLVSTGPVIAEQANAVPSALIR